MDIGIFIEYNNRVVQIPVNPEKLQVKTGSNNDTAEIIALGEIVIPRKPKLSTISWESFFPYKDWFPAVRTSGDFKSANFYVDFLNEIQEDCKPCHLTVTGIEFDDDVVIESFDYHHQAGDHEDTYYSITLKKYQPYSVTVLSKDEIPKPIMGNPPSSSSPTLDPSQITIGSTVYLNGRVHKDSYGSKPGKTFTNYKCKVNLINKKGSHPYHVTTTSGDALGWVTKKSLSLSKATVKKKKKTTKTTNPPLKTKATQTFSTILRTAEARATLPGGRSGVNTPNALKNKLLTGVKVVKPSKSSPVVARGGGLTLKKPNDFRLKRLQ